MSVITNNPLGPGFPATGGGFDFERSNGNALATVLGSNPRIRSDNVRLGPPGLGALLPGGSRALRRQATRAVPAAFLRHF